MFGRVTYARRRLRRERFSVYLISHSVKSKAVAYVPTKDTSQRDYKLVPFCVHDCQSPIFGARGLRVVVFGKN